MVGVATGFAAAGALRVRFRLGAGCGTVMLTCLISSDIRLCYITKRFNAGRLLAPAVLALPRTTPLRPHVLDKIPLRRVGRTLNPVMTGRRRFWWTVLLRYTAQKVGNRAVRHFNLKEENSASLLFPKSSLKLIRLFLGAHSLKKDVSSPVGNVFQPAQQQANHISPDRVVQPVYGEGGA